MIEQFLDHFNNPRNVGVMDDAHGYGRAGDPGCGVVIEFYIRFRDGCVEAASCQATGSSSSISCGSLLTEIVTGKHWRYVAAISEESLTSALGSGGEVKPSLRTAAMFAVEALHGALEDSLRRNTFPDQVFPENPADESVLVAMSGGVDSSVACLLERDSCMEVLGVTMRLWSDPDCENSGAQTCCSPQAIRDARTVCHGLGLPHLTLDYKEEFASTVVDSFVDGYLAGQTPNPCTRCNGNFRFPELVALAERLGISKVATGHYVRMVEDSGQIFLTRAADCAKDQSYMLWGIDSRLLERLEFPLGEMTKVETRRMALDAGLVVHDRPESQEVCFIPDDDYRRFVRSRAAGSGRAELLPGEGEIVDEDGTLLGSHMGFIDFTVGQRHGLGVSASEPLYVLRTVPQKNQVIAGRRQQLEVRSLKLSGINSFIQAEGNTCDILEDAGCDGISAEKRDIASGACSVQLRYNSKPVAVKKIEVSGDSWRVELEEPAFGVAPGQSAVFYRNLNLIAGGIIEETV